MATPGFTNFESERYVSIVVKACLTACLLVTWCGSGTLGEPVGGVIRQNVVYKSDQSPLEVTKDIIIARDGKLTIEPGVTLYFRPGTGINVEKDGTLIALGEADRRVVFTKHPDNGVTPTISYSALQAPAFPDIRLVDGDTTLEGRLQIRHKLKWHSVCTNSKNWTQTDINVACQQLGFKSGTLYHWFERTNDTRQLMLERPTCQGNETNLSTCQDWQKKQIGSGVCDHHLDIGIRCDPTLKEDSTYRGYWRGIKFENAASLEKPLYFGSKIKVRESKSILKNMDISYAGVDAYGNVSSALLSVGIPPIWRDSRVEWSASTAVNFSLVTSPFEMIGGLVRFNQGYGIFVNSSFGQVTLHNVSVSDNGADGVRYVFHEEILPFSVDDFCSAPSFGKDQIYPVSLSYVQIRTIADTSVCTRTFRVARGTTLTAHFPVLISEANPWDSTGFLEIHDGDGYLAPILARFPIVNGSRPQSMSSSKESLTILYSRPFNKTALFTVQVIANYGKAYDLNLTDCNITNNNGRGVAIENQRSGSVINRTLVSGSNYVAGVTITRGAGDFVLNNSRIENNLGDGINSTRSGGYTHFDRSTVANNTGRGVAIWYNETSESLAFNFTAHLSYSVVADNGLQGLLVWNSCRSDLFWNVSTNSFFGNRKAAVQVQSCLEYDTANSTTLLVTNNQFKRSHHLAIKLPYVLNINGLIEHNTFEDHHRGVLLASNRDLENYLYSRAELIVRFNEFFNNKGAFVVRIGLLEGSEDQRILFTRNRLYDNEVVEAFHGLQPRSRVAAVVTVESTNTIVYRNYFVNPKSKFELGSHLEHHNRAINATMNYWGVGEKQNVKLVYEKIFDRKDRFNLALIEFTQYITSSTDLETIIEISEVKDNDKILPFNNGDDIGGEVKGRVTLEKNVYKVTRDIYVHPGSELEVKPGAVFNFGQSLGMMVQGRLRSEGNSLDPITYTVKNGGGPGAANVPVRLSNGTEGRLEVRTADGWKSVCLYGWDVRDAAVACQQLGLVLNTRDWLLERSQFPISEFEDNIGLSNVQCDDIDTDLTACKAETVEDFENSCPFEVGIRCFPPTWAGIRIGMLAEKSFVKYSKIEKAGVVDYATNNFRPALQLDFNRHDIQYVTVVDSSDSGLGIMWNDLYSENDNRKIVQSTFTSNKLHGVVTRSQGVDIIHSKFLDNLGSAIHYDPAFTKEEQLDLLSWINFGDGKTVVKVERSTTIEIQRDEYKFIVFRPVDTRPFDFQIKTDARYNLGIIVLNPLSDSSPEDLTIYGRLETMSRLEFPEWNLRRNLTSFPLRHEGFGVSAKYTPGNGSEGTVILYIRSIVSYQGGSRKRYEQFFPQIRIEECIVNKCGRGFSSNHYNRDKGHEGHFYHRYANESVSITSTAFKDMIEESVYVSTPHWDEDTASLAEINYTLKHVQITGGNGGIVQYNRDIRNSNNLYHWVINHTMIERNLYGGINIRLPYVWQYNENYTHSLVMSNSAFQQNENFECVIGGHFARVNITGNLFKRNFCKLGVLDIWGMEKEMRVEENILDQNNAEFVVQFNLQSHAEKFGLVPAEFRKNVLRDNRDSAVRTIMEPHHPASYGLSLRGVQPINVTRNVLENPNMQFELLAGMLTGTIVNRVNVEHNWWGTTNVSVIQKKIFDFDDWNNYAIADFVPYSGTPSVDAGGIPDQLELRENIDFNQPLGGRLTKHLTLHKRSSPYIVASDLTVMPGVTLTIDEDVQIEFHPSVGILVLGELIARGISSRPISMRPYRSKKAFRFERYTDVPGARLCVDEACESIRRDGFLELYNTTTMQWVPVCDPRFSERNAEVICSELGYNRVNVRLKRGPRWDLGTNQLSRIRSWPHPLSCDGREKSVSECEYRLNGYSDKYYACSYPGDFVYLYCGEENRASNEHYWGGIRFSVPNFELRVEDRHFTTHNFFIPPLSVLQHVYIEGAGMLHGEKTPAIQMVQREVLMNNVKIVTCASHGIEVIAPPANIYFNQLDIHHNLGLGVNVLILSGDASGDIGTSFPIRDINFPYNVFGMVDICDTKKQITIQERVLLYFKYDYVAADCVKIFNSANEAKEIGFRILHLNLFNSTGLTTKPDTIRIYDGNIYNDSIPLLGEIAMDKNFMDNERVAFSFLKSTDSSISVQLHISGGSEKYGFIAEVVTLPVAFANSRDLRHNITNSIITNNELGGMAYRSAGESTPALTISHSRIDYNGRSLFGNFTTSDSAVLLDVQNQQHFYFLNNLLLKNQGGLRIFVDSQSSVAALNGKVQNNLFCENENLEAFFIEGLYRVGQYQRIDIAQNYFTRNYAMYKDTVVLSQVMSNFYKNLLVNNTGKHIMDVYGFDKVSVSHQTCSENSFYDNHATKYMERSTIYAGNVGQRYYRNYFVNRDNDFEMATANKSMYESRHSVINATYNWWGYNETSAVSGRIRDRRDYEELLEVEFFPFHNSNATILSGKCSAGWQLIGSTCFLYVGGRMTHHEAKLFCEADNASLPYTKSHQLEDLMYFLDSQQDDYDRFYLRVWVQSIDIDPSLCPVLHDGKVYGQKCSSNLQFLCEKDPDIIVSNDYWFKQPIAIAAISVASIAVFIVLICLGFWFCKSRVKYQEKLERRNSIRASIRSNSMASFGELGYKRRLERRIGEEPTPKITDFKMNGSVDSISKTPQSRLSCSMDDSQQSYDILETRNSHIGYGGTFTDQFAQDPQLENANVEALVRPTFDLTYENNGYVERGISRASEDRGSREWSASTSSTLDMKRALGEQQAREVESRSAFTPSSRASSNDSYSTNDSGKEAPLETAM